MLALKCPRGMDMDEFLSRLQFPLLATPKIDGIRCITHPPENYPDWISTPLTRSMKWIPNRHIRESLATQVIPYIDGELVVGRSFQACTSGIMSANGAPNFTYYVFDCGIDRGHEAVTSNPYEDRVDDLKTLSLPEFCEPLIPVLLRDLGDLASFEEMCLNSGAEGVMVRPPGSPPYQGRSSFRNPWLVAIKRFVDSEARVEIIHELMHNGNVPEMNALGYKERSSHRALMVGMKTMGSLECVDLESGQIFCVGTGFTADQRKEIWDQWPKLKGRIIKYRYQSHGTLNAPRIPTFLGTRDECDMSHRSSGQLRLSV